MRPKYVNFSKHVFFSNQISVLKTQNFQPMTLEPHHFPPPRFSYRNRNLRTHPIHGHENRPVSSVPRDDQSRWWWMNYEPLGIQVILLMGPWNPAETPVEVGSLSHCSQGFIHPRCCRISSINSRNPVILSKIEQGVSFITSETHRSFRFHDTILRRWTIFNEFVPKTAYHVACFLVKLWKTRVNLNCGLFKQLKTIDLKFCLMLAKNQLASSSLSQHTHTCQMIQPKSKRSPHPELEMMKLHYPKLLEMMKFHYPKLSEMMKLHYPKLLFGHFLLVSALNDSL